MHEETPIVLITPDAKTALEVEAERTGIGGNLVGGLLFGYPLDESHRLVVSSVRPRPEVGFGEKEFSIDQSRTSRQLAEAREIASEVDYCGVWYLHRTPNKKLSDQEWVQMQAMLEDPDYRFDDLVCLVICLYFGELNTYAFYFDKYHSARSQAPKPTVLKLTTDLTSTSAQAAPSTPSRSPTDWYKTPEIAERLKQEHARLSQRYHVEATVDPKGLMTFQLKPKNEYGKLVFYLASESGFPDKPPEAFLIAGDKRYPLFSPKLNEWSVNKRMVEIADDLVEWINWSLDQYVEKAKEALDRKDYREAADLLTLVLSINPKTPRAARLLARAQAPLR